MSRKRRLFTAEQKTKIVLEAIRGEKEINEYKNIGSGANKLNI